MDMSYQDVNAATIDRWVEEGWKWGQPISHETYLRALAGQLGPQGAERGAGLIDLRQVKIRTDPEDQVARFDAVSFLGEDFHHVPGDIRRDLDLHDRSDDA